VEPCTAMAKNTSGFRAPIPRLYAVNRPLYPVIPLIQIVVAK
jgi:hypothetical protein